MLEFGVPRGLARPAWEPARIASPAAGMAISWLARKSARCSSARASGSAALGERSLSVALAGLEGVQSRRMSLGGGLVMWARKG